MNRKVLRNKAYLMAHSFNRTKLFHSKKGWLMSSALVLAMLGVGASANQARVHAAPVNNGGVQQSASAQEATQANVNNKSVSSASVDAPVKASNIASQAGQMHGLIKTANNKINLNTPNTQSSSNDNPVSKSASDNNGMQTLTFGTPAQQKRSWNYVQHGINHDDYDNSEQSATSSLSSATQSASSSASASSIAPSNSVSVSAKSSFNSAYQSYEAQMSGIDSEVASANADNVQSDKKNIKKPLLKDNSHDDVITGTYDGLTYKYDKTSQSLEFTGGKINVSNATNFLDEPQFGGSPANGVYVGFNHSIKSVKFDNNIDTSNVTYMNSMFNQDTSLQSINFGNNFNTSKVTDMGNMFSNTKLQSLVLPKSFSTNNVSNMQHMFSGDAHLQSLVLPDSFDTNKVSNMTNMFANDTSLQSIVLPAAFNSTNVASDDGMGMFMSDNKLQSITLNSSNNLADIINGSNSGALAPGFDYPNWFNQAYGKSGNTVSTSPTNLLDGEPHIGTFLSAPSSESITINFQDNGVTVKSLTTPNQKANTKVDISNYVPTGYKLANSSQNITADGKTYNITVQKLSKAAPYGVVYLNQNKTEVGQATLSNLGYVGQTVNVEPQLAANVPQGYHLDNTNPINVTLNDGGIINVDTSNNVGANYHGMLGGMLRDSPANTDNHVITVSGNPINYNGNVTLNFKANGKTVKSITKPYSVNTYTGDTVNLLNPASYLDGSNLTDNNNNPITINNTYFTPDGNNNPETVTVQPSDAPQASGNTKINNSYVLNYNANSVNDNITYDLSGSNIPSNYQGQTGRLNGTSLSGVYDTNVPLSALNNDVPTNYHIVSGSNIRYDNGSHTVELAPNSENVNVTYTDQTGKTYVGSVNGQYDQKINDITNNYNLPNGYHVNAGQDNSYTFNGNQNQNKALNITGNTQDGNVTITIKKYDGGNYIGSDTTTVHESGETGNGFTINPTDKQFTPDGYSSQSEQYNGTFTPTGLSTNTVVFNYKAGAGTAISVNYTNQHGTNVGSGMVTGNTDDTGNISNQVPVPDGYTVDANQPSQYHILAGAQNPINIKVTGKPVSELNGHGKFTITINKHIGSKVVPSTKVIQVSGKVGDTFTVTPSNYTPNAKGYTSTTHPVQSTITPNGLAQSSATFDYTANTGDPINVTYKNQTGKVVGNGSFTGVVDQTGDITSYVKVPSDYTLNGGQNTNFTTTLSNQNMTLNVTGKPANATINFINQNGYPAGAESVNGKAGDTVSPSSYPKGYEVPTTSTKYTFNKSGQNPDEDNVRLTGKIAGDINNSKAKNAPKTATNGYVTVHVVEKSTNGKLLHQFDTPVSENQKRVGDSYTVEPSDVTPSNYDVASGDNSVNGVINTDGSVSNGNVTDTYTVHASDIEPISITIKNQNGHYIDLSTGKLTNSVDKATSTIDNTTLAQLGGVGDSVDITNYINAPKGYHINGNKENIEDVNGQKLDAITLEHKRAGFGAMPLMLALWSPAPKSNSNANKPASSANVKPNSASVVPSSKASSTNSSASVKPISANEKSSTNSSANNKSTNSTSSVIPSTNSSSVNSTQTNNIIPSATNSATPLSVQPQFIVTPSNSASSSVAPSASTSGSTSANTSSASDNNTTPALSNSNSDTTTPTLKPNTQPSIQPESDNNIQPSSPNNVVTPSYVAPTGNNVVDNEPTEESPIFSNVPSDNEALANNTVATPNNNTATSKLPQTNEATNYAGITAMITLMLGVGLAGIDLKRKYE